MPSVDVNDSRTVTESVTVWHLTAQSPSLGPLTAALFATAQKMGIIRAIQAGAYPPLLLGGGSSPLDGIGYPTTPGTDGAPKNSLDGATVAPCLTLYRTGLFGPILVPCSAGARTLSIDVKYGQIDDGAATRPQIIIRGTELGVPETTIAVSGSPNTWQTYQANFTAHAAGALQIFLNLRNTRIPGIDGLISGKVYASFDNLQIN